MSQQREKLFSRANVHTAIWTTALAICTFYSGKVYDSLFGEEPQRVIVENFPQPTVVTQAAQPPPTFSDASTEELRKMREATEAALREMQAMRSSASSSASQKAEAERRIAQLELEVGALTKAKAAPPAVTGPPLPNPPTNVEVTPLVDRWPYKPYATVIYPTTPPLDFVWPRAYVLNNRPKLFKDPRCPQPTTIPGKSRVRVSFLVATAAQLSQMSPLSVSVLREDVPKQLKQYFETTLMPTVGANVIELETNFDAGKHYLMVGYVLRDDLTKELPTFYAVSCALNVSETSSPAPSIAVQ